MAIAPVREAGQRFAFNFQGVERDTPFVKSACLKSGNQRIVLNSRELSSVYEELGQVIALARVELEGTSRDRWGGRRRVFHNVSYWLGRLSSSIKLAKMGMSSFGRSA